MLQKKLNIKNCKSKTSCKIEKKKLIIHKRKIKSYFLKGFFKVFFWKECILRVMLSMLLDTQFQKSLIVIKGIKILKIGLDCVCVCVFGQVFPQQDPLLMKPTVKMKKGRRPEGEASHKKLLTKAATKGFVTPKWYRTGRWVWCLHFNTTHFANGPTFLSHQPLQSCLPIFKDLVAATTFNFDLSVSSEATQRFTNPLTTHMSIFFIHLLYVKITGRNLLLFEDHILLSLQHSTIGLLKNASCWDKHIFISISLNGCVIKGQVCRWFLSDFWGCWYGCEE